MERFLAFGGVAALLAGCALPAGKHNPPPTLCASKLAPEARRIFDAAAPDMHTDTDLKSLLRARIMPMVITGTMTANEARIAAYQAVPCLNKLRH